MSRFARIALSRFRAEISARRGPTSRLLLSYRSAIDRSIIREFTIVESSRHSSFAASRYSPRLWSESLQNRETVGAFDRSDPPLGGHFRPSRFTFVPSATFIRFRGSRRNYGRRFLDDSLLRLAELRPRLEFLGALQARRRSVFSQRLHNCRRNVTRECPDAGRAARRIAGANEMARAR